MAMKPCRECKEQVSTQAKTCPHCGTKNPANPLAALGSGVMGCGCLLTILVTIPALMALCTVA